MLLNTRLSVMPVKFSTLRSVNATQSCIENHEASINGSYGMGMLSFTLVITEQKDCYKRRLVEKNK